jgi:hypothetical protein
MELLKKIWNIRGMRYILPVFTGGLLGFLYYTFIGCNGSCAITGNPWISTGYGSLMGAFFINKSKKE